MGTHLSARMAIGRELLVIFAVGTLGLVQGFGLGPSLEWKDGDAEMWAQVPEIAALVSSAPPSKVFVESPRTLGWISMTALGSDECRRGHVLCGQPRRALSIP